ASELSSNVAEPVRISAAVADAVRLDVPLVERAPPLTRIVDPLEVESDEATCNKRLPPVMLNDDDEAEIELESDATKLPLETEIELE
ncbi:hypothetical protein ABTE14_19790, partial [Acinetobacter baumannii]